MHLTLVVCRLCFVVFDCYHHSPAWLPDLLIISRHFVHMLIFCVAALASVELGLNPLCPHKNMTHNINYEITSDI